MSPKERPKDPLNLEQLDETYEVIGELSGRRDARSFIAKRREDGGDVLITVAETPDGDEGNALSHLAADTNLLSAHTHRNLLPIVEGRWLGTDAFALVTERIYAPALEELLSRRDEAFDYPRIATILQDVNAVLEWARGLKVVHRAVALDTLYLEPGSDRVLVSFAMRPLPLADMPGPEEDAKTVATLARAMLTRSAAAPERANLPLAELRPGLPTKLIEQTDMLLQLSRGSKVPDVTGYIAVIAMAEALKRSETEGAEATLKMLDEARLAREKIEGERLATERAAAEQARLFQKEREEFAKENGRIERALAKEREALAQERAALAQEREEHAQDRAALISEREEHKLWAEQVQKQLTTRGAALESQAAFVVPPPPKRKRVKPAWWTRAWQQHPHWNRKWNVPAAVAGLALLIAVSGLAISRNREPARARGVEVARTPVERTPVERTPVPRVVDSMAGAVATPIAAPFGNALNVPADLIAGVAARAAAAPPPPPRMEGAVAPRLDTIFTPAAPVRTDSVAKPKADSVPKRDSLPRDTLPRRDTLQVLPRAAP